MVNIASLMSMRAVQVAQRLSHSPSTEISGPERQYGVLLLREQGSTLEAFVSKDRGLVASQHALYVETDRSAACRYMEADDISVAGTDH